jgi:hypothetical protein
MSHKLFPSQRPEEKIYLVVREHWVRLGLKLVIWGVFASLPTLLYRYGPDRFPNLFEGTAGQLLSLSTAVYGLVALFTLFIIWVLYYLNVHIVSDERIVDIDQIGLLRHVISELNIETIEDVTSDTTGVLGNLFDFGTVFIQTAGTTERFQFENVPNPTKIAGLILDLYERQTSSNHPRPGNQP